METTTDTRLTLEALTYLPSFAQYLLQHRLNDFVAVQMQYLSEVDIPMMKYFRELSSEELFQLSMEANKEYLTYLSQNRARQQITESIRQWKENQLPVIKKEEIVAEDITLATYLRKRVFLHFIPDYTSEIDKVIELVKEIDLLLAIAETELTNTYINILKQTIQEDSLIIEKINDTIPGAVYVFDIKNFKGIFSNHKLEHIIGYNHGELNIKGTEAINELLHPDDKEGFKKHITELSSAADGEIKIYTYRVKDKTGNYRWLSNYESVFKRDEEGAVQQTIGITLDVDKEQNIAHDLRENKKLHEQAEALTHLGSYTWIPSTNELSWSDELYRIYDLEPRERKIDYGFVESFNFPEDTAAVRVETSRAISTHSPFDFYYRIKTSKHKEKILHARGNILKKDSGDDYMVLGTVQDVTEKQTLITKLRQNESVYKQAEELANMGNWSWTIETNELEWTDHLYKIYGIPPGEEVTIERFLSMVHPDDREEIREGTEKVFTNKILDYTFRIITPAGKTKILRSVAQVQFNEHGHPVRVIGTERDITEKQNLIDRLQRSELLYKQAQALAHVGNWSWDIQTNKLEWSDELYNIYGLDLQYKELTYDYYLLHVHPDDRPRVMAQVQHAVETGESWEYTHRLIRPNGDIRFVFATGEVLRNANGTPYMVIGTAQDVTERQLLIDKLQESEKLSRQAQALAHLGNWSLDIKTGEFLWSEEMYKIFELAKDSPMNLEIWSKYLHPSEKEEIISYYETCLREKRLYDKIHKIYLPSGKVKTIHRKGEFIYDDHGDPVRMIGTTQDISEEYRVQQELKENQTFIRKITDATPSIIASYNVNTGKYVFISEGLEKLLGYNTEEVLEDGIKFFERVTHPSDWLKIAEKKSATIEEVNANLSKNDIVVEYTYRMRHKNGDYRWMHTYETIFDRNSDGSVEHVLNISLDISHEINATEKIKEQEHFIQQIADASPTILYLFDVYSQSIQYINREIFFVLGYLPEEIILAANNVTSMLYHPEDYHLLPARKEGNPDYKQVDSMVQYECRVKNKEGDWRWLLIREIVFKTDDNGNILQILGTALDINRRKEMERTILQNTLLLEQSNASLEEFAYVASHDLKEPLRKISTFGDRLIATQAETLAPDGKVYLQKIVDASSRMQTMINDLLAISMITGNTSFEEFSLQEILDEVIQTLEFKIEQVNAIIRSDKLPSARIIPSQFRQLFQNLVSNSLKFVRPDVQPEIRITYKTIQSSELSYFQLKDAQQYHKIEFADNGIGFEMEYSGKIFAIFQRLHGRSEYEGSGIGLAICKKIVEHHGGIIYAASELGKGSTFTIILPY
ncbi:MAG: PAS domain-containing protein [Flavisolibacter sp.]